MGKFHERIKDGKCGVCGVNVIDPPKKKCECCLEYGREYMRKRREKLKKASACLFCKVTVEGGSYCDDCKEYLKKSNEKLGAEYRRSAVKKSRKKLRRDVIVAYGGKCECCGEKEFVFLTMDHVEGGGNQHRRELGGNMAFYVWLRKNGYPPKFQVLCWNCNWAKSHGGCPHKCNIIGGNVVIEQQVREKMEQLGVTGYSSMSSLDLEMQMAQLLVIQKIIEKRAEAVRVDDIPKPTHDWMMEDSFV